MKEDICGDYQHACQHVHQREDTLQSSFQNSSAVAEYYKGRIIFITGGTGFMGKVILEKLLRCCPEVKKVYLLLRPKDKKDASSRLQELLSSKVWDLIRQEDPSLLSKLVAIEGDITSQGLGISQADNDILTKEVSVVFHVAATVKFNETLRVAVSYNLEGTEKVTQLARKMKSLEAFVYMSTAFSNCNRQEIRETVYPSSVRPEDILSLLEWVDDHTLDILTPKLTKGHPNTYTFSKLLAENYLADSCRDLPVTIVRPAIVTASWKEPFPGWVDNTYGPSGLFAAVRRGILKTTLVNEKGSVELTPVDMAANLVIVAARYHNRETTEISRWPVVLNYSSGPVNRIGMDVLFDNVMPRLLRPRTSDEKHRLPPNYQPSRNSASYGLRCMLRHYLPAALADICAVLSARRPRMLSACRRLQKVLSDYTYFTLNEWSFRCDGAMQLLQGLSAEDQKIFNFNLKKVEWPSYFESYAEGVCRFVLGETVDLGLERCILPKSRHLSRNLLLCVKVSGLTVALGVLLLKVIKMFKFILNLLSR